VLLVKEFNLRAALRKVPACLDLPLSLSQDMHRQGSMHHYSDTSMKCHSHLQLAFNVFVVRNRPTLMHFDTIPYDITHNVNSNIDG